MLKFRESERAPNAVFMRIPDLFASKIRSVLAQLCPRMMRQLAERSNLY